MRMELFLVVFEMEIEGETEFDEATVSTPVVFPAVDQNAASVIADRIARHLGNLIGADLRVEAIVRLSDPEPDGEPLLIDLGAVGGLEARVAALELDQADRETTKFERNGTNGRRESKT